MKIHEVPDEQFVKNIRNVYLDAIRLLLANLRERSSS